MNSPHRALCLAAFAVVAATAGAAEPAASAPQVVPAKANEGPTTLGPLPVVKPGAPVPGAAPAASPSGSAVKQPDLSPDDAFPTVGAEEVDQESLGGTLLRTLLVLGVVVALIYLSLNYGLRKLMGVRGMPVGRSSLVKVVERIPLDPKRSLFVVHAAGEYLLLGGGEEGMTLLTRLDPAEVEAHLAQKPQRKLEPSPFLQKLLSRSAKPPPDQKV